MFWLKTCRHLPYIFSCRTNLLFIFFTVSYPFIRDYGHQKRAFFQKSKTFELGQTNRAKHFGDILGIFGRFISIHFGTVSPLSMFPIIQTLFLQKAKPLYPTPKYLLGSVIWICAAKNLRFKPSCVRSPCLWSNQIDFCIESC